MSKPKAESTIQADPTRPRRTDPRTGRALDEHGLPLAGPARAARLAELGKPDPLENPAAWGEAPPEPVE